MRWRSMCWLGIAAIAAAVPKARAGEPVAGVDVGASIPVSTFQRVADPGGTIAPFVGYQFGNRYAFTPIVQPAFFTFATDQKQNVPGTVTPSDDSNVTSLFGILGGGRFSLFDDKKEVYFTIQGGYYTDITGPLNDKGEGFMFGGGFNYEFWPGTALGIFIRRDQSSIRAARNSTHDLEFLVSGLSVRHQFLPPPPPPPPPPPVVAAAPPPPPVEKKKFVLRGVNFDFDKSNIRADAEPILDAAAATLKEESSIAVSVEGHTDSRGTDAYNERLSVRRANAVRDYLVRHGIDATRMSVRGFGESQPVASNDTDDGRAQNRRVELRVQ